MSRTPDDLCPVTGKWKRTEADAFRAAHRLRQQHGRKMRAYKCPGSDHWHISHEAGAITASRRNRKHQKHL